MTIEQDGPRMSLVYKNIIFENDEHEDKSEGWENGLSFAFCLT